MAGFQDADKAFFPIKTIATVIQVFKNQLTSSETGEPDLALLSIIAGAVENSLTCRSSSTSALDASSNVVEHTTMPVLELHTVEVLYNKFRTIIKTSVEVPKDTRFATRTLIKRVSDVIWNSLTRSYYKDRAHLQSLYSYLTGSKLDCFGVAFAVVAGCQVLGFSDVHLALSEDHAWVVFGENGTETAEVTWHGKGNEDKRGQEIGKGVSAKSWLYVNNNPVICTRAMEVVALVSSINPSLNATHDAFEVALLQQELLWLLYDLGHLKRYPMAIGNLGDLEEISKTEGRISCSVLFEEAILSARTYYNNQHVYPYTYQGGYFYRNKMYKEAFESWANASDVIRLYNYYRDDEEIYKEFLEIANELIPHIMKVESSGFSATSILKQPECFANLLRFYDGICQWEEGSATPVLHIGWAKPLVNTISKFDAEVRARVNVLCEQPPALTGRTNGSCVNNNNNYKKEDGEMMGTEVKKEKMHPSIEALTAACGEKILNPEYLLQGDGSPFVGGEDASLATKNPMNGSAGTSKQPPEESEEAANEESQSKPEPVDGEEEEEEEEKKEAPKVEEEEERPTVVLHSQKMKELKDLLLAEKLNTQAISLHLTAQSQVQVGKKGRGEPEAYGVRPKRTRRE